MLLVHKIDEFGKLGWAAAIIISFWLAWPLGLMLIAFLAGSGRLTWRGEWDAPGTWFNLASRREHRNSKWGGFRGSSSGNEAFDAYREETLRKLEEEEREFKAFLDRLRKARDKAEFDAFMAERRQRTSGVQDVSAEPTA